MEEGNDMKFLTFFKDRLKGLTDAITRYPLTTIILIIASIINAIDINSEKDLSKILLTLIIGVFLSAVAQVSFERFFLKPSTRYLLMGIVILMTGGYYLIIGPASTLGLELMIRTSVALFALLFAFIWIPVIKSKVSFNQSFMISFKSIFNSLFFSGVIYGGITIIITAVDQLIFSVDYKAYAHGASLIFILFAPMYFLSLIPTFPGKSSENNDEVKNHRLTLVERAANCPKFFEVLISYIIIPLIAVYTVILIIYIIQNIGGEFWSDNLLEPMIVSYSITIIVVYLLTSEIKNKFTVLFRSVLPKILIPIVIFQVVSSILSLSNTGVTHTRYYVILYGVFALIASVCFSLLPVRKNGIVAALLIVFSLFSTLPPVDAFTISKSSQRATVEEVLIANHMLENNTVQPNGNISNDDKQIITRAMEYLNRMDYVKELEWLPEDFNYYEDFSNTFGFQEYYGQQKEKDFVYVSLDPNTAIPITGYDVLINSNIYFYPNEKNIDVHDIKFESNNGEAYTLVKEVLGDEVHYTVYTEDKEEVIRFETEVIMDKFYDYQTSKEFLPVEELTFTSENDRASIKIIAQNVNIDRMSEETSYMLDLYVFVDIK
ncbi:DUF4153 domain-containing protein [Niallia sp. Krafla_26]|uniref:DUF4153 domain-containing protein n=1 Tax=Niallia sp. Krafla_26 TaxID=3064703 RepID=UPI003D1657B4